MTPPLKQRRRHPSSPQERLAGEVPPERVVEMLESGAQPLQDLIAALHTKLMVAELERHRLVGVSTRA
jgi:hypothetical protein